MFDKCAVKKPGKTIEFKGKCFVELRDFPFSNYPPYVKRLSHYRWKPLIIAMALKDFGAVWYMDTSVRWKKDRLSKVYDEIRCRKDHPWSKYVLCALEQTCMAPPKSELRCSFKDPFTIYAGCHRYDQSVINLLLANSYGYNSKNYVSNLGAEGASISRTFSKSLKPEDFSCNLTVSYQ
nr:Protein of unknown function DUF1647 domain containing protein [Haemonchus contortus]